MFSLNRLIPSHINYFCDNTIISGFLTKAEPHTWPEYVLLAHSFAALLVHLWCYTDPTIYIVKYFLRITFFIIFRRRGNVREIKFITTSHINEMKQFSPMNIQ